MHFMRHLAAKRVRNFFAGAIELTVLDSVLTIAQQSQLCTFMFLAFGWFGMMMK
jgi:hypothetical protein